MERLEHDIRCSTACTRAIVWALLFSAIAAAMWQPLEKAKSVNAFLKYTSLRVELTRLVEDLETDDCWRGKLLPTVGKDKVLALKVSELGKYKCGDEFAWSYETSWLSRKRDRPVDLKILDSHLEEPKKMVDLLTELIQGDILKTSGAASYAAKGPIGRWATLLSKKLETANNLPPRMKEILVSTQSLENLTWGDILELSKSELPSFPEAETMKIQLSIGLPSIPSIDLGVGSGVVELGLLFAMLYFLLYECEAFRFKIFPSSGTLFAVFFSRRSTRVLFTMLISIPPLAAALLALKSLSPGDLLVNSSLAFLVLLVSILIRARASSVIALSGHRPLPRLIFPAH